MLSLCSLLESVGMVMVITVLSVGISGHGNGHGNGRGPYAFLKMRGFG